MLAQVANPAPRVAVREAPIDLLDLHIAVRALHVLAATVLIGGATLVSVLALRGRHRSDSVRVDVLVYAAHRYEWISWPAIGVIVASGVGNLGALGEALPGLETRWGGVLLAKLALIFVLLPVSVVRTLVVSRLPEVSSSAAAARIRDLYLLTALLGLVIVSLAVWLAHG